MTGASGPRGPDPETVRRAQAGDRGSFRELAEQVRPLVTRWALARTGDPDEADEVAQRVLLRLHRHLESFERRSRFTTWLYRVTANTAATLEADRERRARHLCELEKAGRAVADPRNGDPVDRVHAQRVSALVRTYLDDLSDRQREAFDLVDLQGLSPRAAAEMMEIEPATVRVHLHRARRMIRSRILDLHPELEEGYEA